MVAKVGLEEVRAERRGRRSLRGRNPSQSATLTALMESQPSGRPLAVPTEKNIQKKGEKYIEKFEIFSKNVLDKRLKG